MDIVALTEKTSLWGVLHDGELRDIRTDAARQTADLLVSVHHLNDFFGWPQDAGIRFQFAGVTELRVNQWIPDPAHGSQDVRSRRWSRREWRALEEVVPPRGVMVMEASFARLDGGGRLELAGYEYQESGFTTDIWLEIVIQGAKASYATPDGPCDLDRLVQIGDAYWDNIGKKRKSR